MPFSDGREHPPATLSVDAYRGYADLGLQSIGMVPLPGRASTTANGGLLAAAIRKLSSRGDVDHIVLVGYSKGTADAMEALALLLDDGGDTAKVRALVSVAGSVVGSPIADHYASLYDRYAERLKPFGCSPSEGGEIDSLTRAERLAWLAAHPLPESVAYYSVVAHTDPDSLSRGLRHSGRLLRLIDPRNDGQMIAADAIIPASLLLAEARTDHWSIALPRFEHAGLLMRVLGPRGEFPREALLRALLRFAIDRLPAARDGGGRPTGSDADAES
jgi:hypothetical protein